MRPLLGDWDSDSLVFMLCKFIKTVGDSTSITGRIRRHKPRMVVAVPIVIPDKLNDALTTIQNTMRHELFIIQKPLAIATTLGKDLLEKGGMIVDMGASSTVISIIGNYGIVEQSTLPVGGDVFDRDIMEYVRNTSLVRIGQPTASRAKIDLGISASLESEGFILRGPNLSNGNPTEVMLVSSEIATCLNPHITQIEEEIARMLATTHMELRIPITQNGIYLVGGSSQLKGLDERLRNPVGVPCRLVPDPRHITARGAYKALTEDSRCLFTFQESRC